MPVALTQTSWLIWKRRAPLPFDAATLMSSTTPYWSVYCRIAVFWQNEVVTCAPYCSTDKFRLRLSRK